MDELEWVSVSTIAYLEKRGNRVDVIRKGVERKRLFVSFELVLQLNTHSHQLD